MARRPREKQLPLPLTFTLSRALGGHTKFAHKFSPPSHSTNSFTRRRWTLILNDLGSCVNPTKFVFSLKGAIEVDSCWKGAYFQEYGRNLIEIGIWMGEFGSERIPENHVIRTWAKWCVITLTRFNMRVRMLTLISWSFWERTSICQRQRHLYTDELFYAELARST